MTSGKVTALIIVGISLILTGILNQFLWLSLGSLVLAFFGVLVVVFVAYLIISLIRVGKAILKED